MGEPASVLSGSASATLDAGRSTTSGTPEPSSTEALSRAWATLATSITSKIDRERSANASEDGSAPAGTISRGRFELMTRSFGPSPP